MGPKISIVTQGDEQEPVIRIDGFAPAPERLLDDAAMLSFTPSFAHYPGVRAPASPRLVDALLAPVRDSIAATFGVRPELSRREAFYSIVATPPESLSLIQSLPHFDGVERCRLAVLLFLSGVEGSGTAFYQHRSTGFETVSADRLDRFRTRLAEDLAQQGSPAPGYIAGDTPIYRQIARHAGRFNSALIYRGQTLHCADIPAGARLSADPAAGRLTLNIFLDADAV